MNSATPTPPFKPPTDSSLFGCWNRGDRHAGELLFRRYQTTLRMFFSTKTCDSDTEDLLQQVWVELGETLQRGALPPLRTSFRAYLLGVARHVLLRWIRHKYRASQVDPLSSSIAQLAPSVSQAVGDRLVADRMIRALQQLPLDTQVLLEYRYLHEMTVPELAVVYCVPEGTIKSRLSRARELVERTMALLNP